MEDYFYSYLQVAKLEKYYPNFVQSGITHSSLLTNLKTRDYYSLGIRENRDQKKLFQLIDIIRGLDSSEEHSKVRQLMSSSAVVHQTPHQRQRQSTAHLSMDTAVDQPNSPRNMPQLRSPEEMYKRLTSKSNPASHYKR